MSTDKESSAAGTVQYVLSMLVEVTSFLENSLVIGRTLQQRKEDLFDEFKRFCAIGNKPIHDYFVRFHKLVNDMKITQLEIPTHQLNTKFVNNLPTYWGKYTLKKQEQSTSIVDPLAYMAHATPPSVPPPPSTSQPQPAVLSPNDAMMATMTQIANLLSGEKVNIIITAEGKGMLQGSAKNQRERRILSTSKIRCCSWKHRVKGSYSDADS
ncbi:hypothetical protein Tco_1384755 [Tanacetum coccineum]